MRVIRGSHRTGQLDHALKPEESGSMLRRGQQVEDVSEEEGEVMALRAGEMSIHNPFTLHCSGPNTTQARPYPTMRCLGRHHTLVRNGLDLKRQSFPCDTAKLLLSRALLLLPCRSRGLGWC